MSTVEGTAVARLFRRTIPLRADDRELFSEVSSLLRSLPNPNPNLELCVTEALVNAMRHSGGTAVTVTVYRHRGLRGYACTIRDDGTGYDVEAVLLRGFPEDPFQEHGRGIPIIHAVADKVRIFSHGRGIVFSVPDVD